MLVLSILFALIALIIMAASPAHRNVAFAVACCALLLFLIAVV